MPFFYRFLLALAMLLVPPALPAQPLVVSAAASLTNAFQEIAVEFEAAYPDAQVMLNFGASGTLLQQIRQGAPVDVFASADQQTMDRAAQHGLLDPATRRDFAKNTLVLIAPGGRSGPLTSLDSLQDLHKPHYERIAVGKAETVPAGRYARQALEQNDTWNALRPRFIYADSVRQVLDYVARGEVDAGFVYLSDSAVMQGKVQILLRLTTLEPISYPVAVVRHTRHPHLARQFLAHLATPAAKKILERHGFGTP